jgi:hypothetical protein
VTLAAGLLPLLSYATLHARALDHGPGVWSNLEPTWASWVQHVTGAQYRFYLGQFRPTSVEVGLLLRFVYPFLLPWLALWVLAMVLVRDRITRTMTLILLITVGMSVSVLFHYGVPDPSAYFLPVMALAVTSSAPFLAHLYGRGQRYQRLAVFEALRWL